jgi:AcrR family transcriptional regulator
MARLDRTRLPAAERRRQIITVATRLVAERGFWGLSMQDVAAACGLTVPGVLHHVGSKDGLLIAILEHRDAEDVRALESLLPGAAAGSASLREVCAAVVRRNASQPEIVRLFAVLQAESLTPDHPAHDYFVARQERILSEITALAAASASASAASLASPASLAAETTARRIIALMDGVQLQWLRTPGADLNQLWAATAGDLLP